MIIGPIIAVLSFVCSVGNVPLAAVLWSGGISFAGVIAFLFADLIVLPILAIYRKYYGTGFTRADHRADVRDDGDRRADRRRRLQRARADPAAGRARPAPTSSARSASTTSSSLNVLGVAIFAALFWLTVRRGATDPVCGMKVDRAKAVTKEFGGETYYFCSEHCLHAFEADPEQYLGRERGRRGPTHASMPTTDTPTERSPMTERGNAMLSDRQRADRRADRSALKRWTRRRCDGRAPAGRSSGTGRSAAIAAAHRRQLPADRRRSCRPATGRPATPDRRARRASHPRVAPRPRPRTPRPRTQHARRRRTTRRRLQRRQRRPRRR